MRVACNARANVLTVGAEAVVLVDKATGMSKGSGFVFVNDKAAADSLIEGLQNKVHVKNAAAAPPPRHQRRRCRSHWKAP